MLSTFIKLPLVIKIFVLSIFECPLGNRHPISVTPIIDQADILYNCQQSSLSPQLEACLLAKA